MVHYGLLLVYIKKMPNSANIGLTQIPCCRAALSCARGTPKMRPSACFVQVRMRSASGLLVSAL